MDKMTQRSGGSLEAVSPEEAIDRLATMSPEQRELYERV